MSVLIKGMEKPKDCGTCPFERDGFPDEWEMHCVFLDRQVGYFGKKLKVPKDCRNNRADNLEWCTAKYNLHYGKNAPIYNLKHQLPTIIEAEKERDE